MPSYKLESLTEALSTIMLVRPPYVLNLNANSASRNLLRLRRNARCARISLPTDSPVQGTWCSRFALAVFIGDPHQNWTFEKS